MSNQPSASRFLIYKAEDGAIKIEVRSEDETVWLSQPLMAELFGTTQQNVSLHLRNIYEEGGLQPAATHQEYLSVRRESARFGPSAPSICVWLAAQLVDHVPHEPPE